MLFFAATAHKDVFQKQELASFEYRGTQYSTYPTNKSINLRCVALPAVITENSVRISTSMLACLWHSWPQISSLNRLSCRQLHWTRMIGSRCVRTVDEYFQVQGVRVAKNPVLDPQEF